MIQIEKVSVSFENLPTLSNINLILKEKKLVLLVQMVVGKVRLLDYLMGYKYQIMVSLKLIP